MAIAYNRSIIFRLHVAGPLSGGACLNRVEVTTRANSNLKTEHLFVRAGTDLFICLYTSIAAHQGGAHAGF